jgi:hypothetical protein
MKLCEDHLKQVEDRKKFEQENPLCKPRNYRKDCKICKMTRYIVPIEDLHLIQVRSKPFNPHKDPIVILTDKLGNEIDPNCVVVEYPRESKNVNIRFLI